MKAIHWLSSQLFGFESKRRPAELWSARIVESVVVLLTLDFVWKWAEETQRISEVVRPLAFAVWFDLSFLFGPSDYVLAAALTLCTLLGYFRLARWAYALAFLLLVVEYSTRYCLGEIPHSANLVGSAFFGLALGQQLFAEPVFQTRFFLGMTHFLCGLGYTLAAFCKLIATGWGWSQGTHLWVWIRSRDLHDVVLRGHSELNAFQELVLSHWWLATACLTFGWVSEALAWTVWLRRIRPYALMGVVGLHVGIYFTMGITFAHASILLISLIIPWEQLAELRNARLGGGPKLGKPERAVCVDATPG